jgi:hypothetical protein
LFITDVFIAQKTLSGPGKWGISVIPALRRLRQRIKSWRPAWAIQGALP